jgi:hypothetical protein
MASRRYCGQLFAVSAKNFPGRSLAILLVEQYRLGIGHDALQRGVLPLPKPPRHM